MDFGENWSTSTQWHTFVQNAKWIDKWAEFWRFLVKQRCLRRPLLFSRSTSGYLYFAHVIVYLCLKSTKISWQVAEFRLFMSDSSWRQPSCSRMVQSVLTILCSMCRSVTFSNFVKSYIYQWPSCGVFFMLAEMYRRRTSCFPEHLQFWEFFMGNFVG